MKEKAMRHLSLFLAALLAAGPALAENRGVVIANARYQNAPELADADAGAASAAMKAAGFRTVAGADLVVQDVRQALADLLRPDDSPGARIVLLNGRFLHGGSDSWYMGTDADKPDLVGAGSQGVPLSMVLDLIKQAQPGAVLLLGSDEAEMEHAAGLENGIGPLTPPKGVTVISGPPAATSAAAAALLKPGTSVGDVVGADDRLAMAEGGDAQLVLVAAGPDADAPAGPLDADRDLWAKAAAEDTAAAYRGYLDRYPGGLYSAAAKARLDALGAVQSDRDLWADAAAANTVAAYQDYLARYPQGEFAQAAQNRLAELRPDPTPAPAPVQPRAQEIQQPRQASQAELTENRLNLSRGDRVTIQRRLNTLGYSTGGADGIFGSRSRAAIRGWQQRNGYAVTGYLTGSQVDAMRAQANAAAPSRDEQDHAYWQQTGARGGVRNLRAYLDRYPNGIYAQTARQRLANADRDTPRGDREDQAWARARQADTVQSYTQYLQNFPRGEHAEQARQRRNRLINQGQIGNGVIGLDTIIRELVK
ncbi:MULTISPECIES: peptidoglycan-binding domain-containing protein [Paracoccus]|uniref:peptidoglycan-binding domain-containing protein n=1 Tax=Paracoccus TaxID=265 RepID=UPI001FB6CC7D|nr:MULTISPECIES: peptidoglycan-binding domain-containing protein [Paracoccus]MCJ1902680.1 peptidoglycan-binding protein [Paracoccus versutus]MDF3907249.1 peptidoglycan-binding domain-containing protein [Paracoccus sp. AS002]